MFEIPAASRMARTGPPAITPVPLTRWLEEHAPCAKPTQNLVRNGVIDDRHVDHGGPRLLARLTDRLRHFVGLPMTYADTPLPISDDDDRAEAEATSTFDHFRDAVDGDDVLIEILLALSAFSSSVCHDISSEVQTGFTCPFRHGLDTAMVEVSVAVEDDSVKSILLGAFSQQLSNRFC